MTDDPMESIRQAFFEECEELLDQLEEGLLSLQDGERDDETVGAVFRAVHSIKGGAGAFAMTALTEFAHAFENVLDKVRSGTLPLGDDVVLVLLRSADVLADIARATASGDETDPEAVAGARAELAQLETPTSATAPADPVAPAAEPQDDAPVFVPMPIAIEDLDPDDPSEPVTAEACADDEQEPRTSHRATSSWRVVFEPLPGLLASGNEPLYLFRALAVLGSLDVTCKPQSLPTLSDVDTADLFLSWEIILHPASTDLTRTEIENVFDFAESLCHIKIERLQPRDDLSPPAPPSVELPRPADATAPETDDAATATPPPAPAPKPGPTPAPADRAATQKVNSSELRVKPQQSSSVRVDLQRVDALVNLVGEIVISQAMLGQIISEPDRHGELMAASTASIS